MAGRDRLCGIGSLLAALAATLDTAGVAGALAGLADFYRWGYDYGHNLDPDAIIKIPGMTYQPPLLGAKQLLNFYATSWPASGGMVLIAAILVGVVVIAGGLARLGFLTDLLSFPTRAGFMAGIALIIAASQLPKLFGFSTDADGFVTLRVPLRDAPASTDLCLWFTGDTRPAMWVLDRVTLVPSAATP